ASEPSARDRGRLASMSGMRGPPSTSRRSSLSRLLDRIDGHDQANAELVADEPVTVRKRADRVGQTRRLPVGIVTLAETGEVDNAFDGPDVGCVTVEDRASASSDAVRDRLVRRIVTFPGLYGRPQPSGAPETSLPVTLAAHPRCSDSP